MWIQYLFNFFKANFELFFETGTTVITILLIGNFINSKIQRKVILGIEEIISLRVDKANIVHNDDQVETSDTKDVKINDILLVKKGEKVPVDGVIIKGIAYLNGTSSNSPTIEADSSHG